MKMETKENDDVQEDWSTPASPIVVLQKLSEEAVRRAGEALHGAYSGSPIFKTPPQLDPQPRHRRARSEVVASFHRRSGSTSSFQKWKRQMRKALHWNSSSFREGSQFPSFNPEILANQKRQWYQLQSKTLEHEKYKEPTSLFEHFIVAGLHPDANLEVVEDAFIRRKKWEKARAEMLDLKMPPYQQPTLPKLEPQVSLLKINPSDINKEIHHLQGLAVQEDSRRTYTHALAPREKKRKALTKLKTADSACRLECGRHLRQHP